MTPDLKIPSGQEEWAEHNHPTPNCWPLPHPYQHIKAAAHVPFKLVMLRKKSSLQQSWLCTESVFGFSSWAHCCISTWHRQRKVHFILHPSALVTSRFHIRAWNSTYQGQGTPKKCERFKQEFPSLHFCPGRMDLMCCSERGKISPELPNKLLQSGSKFSSLCTVSSTLGTAVSSAEPSASHLSSHSHQKSLQRNASSPFLKERSSSKTAAPQAGEEVFKGRGHAQTGKMDSKGLGSGTVLELCSWTLLPKCRLWSSPAWQTGGPKLFWESNPCCCSVLNAIIQKSLWNTR